MYYVGTQSYPTLYEAIDAMPEWYKGFLGAAVAASFGLRGLANWKK